AVVTRLLFRAGPRKRVWLLRYGKNGRMKIGEWPTMETHEARERARAMVQGLRVARSAANGVDHHSTRSP
ncbi:MAG: integrase arm-type DNA-binding domain-containing protein, partial [Sphingomicrobium sp.]